MPTLSDKELEERLTAAGKSLAQPPSSLDELLPLLDRVEELLSKVEQSPPKTMQNALTPLMKALVMEVLLEHSDIDVKVGVASCISEITRITAPDAPYDDDKMKDVFQLIVSSFENLSDVSSRSHEKRVTILETVAKVRSCVIMLDLECDQMIVDMFQHFLKAIRANHSEMIFTSMETIMTLVIEESEDISPDLLAPILATLRRNNQEVTPIARKLAERVIQNAADKLRPCLRQAVTSLETSFDEYSEVVASVFVSIIVLLIRFAENGMSFILFWVLLFLLCFTMVVEGNCTSASPARDPGTPVVEGNCTSASPARDLGTPNHPLPLSTKTHNNMKTSCMLNSLSAISSMQLRMMGKGPTFLDKDSTAIRSPKSVVSNGINETGTNEITNEANTSKKVDSEGQLEANATFKAESDDCDARKPEKLEAEDEQVQQEEENHDIPAKDVHTSPTEVKPVEAAESLDKGEDRSVEAVTEASKPVEAVIEASKPVEAVIEASKPVEAVTEASKPVEAVTEASKPVEAVTEASKPVEAVNEASPAQSGSHPDKRLSEKDIKETREEELVGEDFAAPQSASEEESISEVKKQRRSGKRRTDESSDKDKALTEEVASKNDDGYASDSEARSLDRAEKPKDASNKKECGSTLRKENVKKSGRGKPKPAFEKDTPKSSAREDHGKDTVTPRKSQLKSTKHEGVQKETPKTSAKRKHTPGKEKVSENLEYGENLVGSKVKVWWPVDRAFYEGVIHAFDSVKKKHKVLYNDGDEETLNLKKERWAFVEDDVVSNGDQDVEHSSHDTSSDVQVKRKGNMSSETTSKHQKIEGSPKSKQKNTATKAGGKSKDDGKAESGSKENYPKASKKSVDDKSKDQSQKVGGKGQVDSAKASGKSKEDVGKHSSRSKQDNLRTPKSKGKTPPGGKTIGSGGTRTTKSSTSKVKETDRMKEKTPDTAKSSETAKRKAADSAKSQESEKVGKKRRK
ncbi:LOW QUALITY PROTEIN: sister chromatid cohesion protein PDS5 homolog C-like [Salvia miltiorrhiza]|uniref:LOW QUALITY PROTEIN: sister chromatid cohesion protein PDS5 homolog C-like n=1 Tax=Salvia miltiorrhiza TaxID=226208 RepID=UPI0025ABFF56|nr:LOW QUALITY PROTEIN: sister chromatid cohesion protein PDS5 homolog C-like [Salvia miltiorrhiza]